MAQVAATMPFNTRAYPGFLVNLKCFLHEGMDPHSPPLRDAVKVLSDRPCTMTRIS